MFLIALITTTLSFGHYSSIQFAAGIELTYDELDVIDGSCHPQDTCTETRPLNMADEVSSSYSCTCNRFCYKYGVCCIDSWHLQNLPPDPKPRCRRMDGEFTTAGYYMVDRCSTGGKSDSVWKSPCEADWKEEDNAILPLAPVTSLLSSMTYKNYFCFRCHEKGNDFLYWNVVLTGNHNGSANVTKLFANEDYIVKYNRRNKTWMATVGRDNVVVPVKMRFEIPSRIKSLNVNCDPNTIISCSENWTDDTVREKCATYQAIMYIKKENETLKYRNPHCALCNFESMDDMRCYIGKFVFIPRPAVFNLSTTLGVNQYHVDEFGNVIVANSAVSSNFSHSVDVNRYDGDKYLPMEQMCGENLVWDPYGKRCLKVSCPDPGFVVRGGKCVPRFHPHQHPSLYIFPGEYPRNYFSYNRMQNWFLY